MAYLHDLADTWNDSGTVFTALKMNVTDTASNASSKLLDLQVGGGSRVNIGKNAQLTFAYSATTDWVSGTVAFGNRYNLATMQTGTALLNLGTTGIVNCAGSASGYAIEADVVLRRDAANTLALRNSTNAQRFNVYETYTDSSNYARGYVAGTTSGLDIGTEAAGTGTKRPVRILGQSLASAEAVSILELSQTWNTTGTPTAIKLNVTDTASNAASLVLDLQQSFTSRFRVRKDGALTINGNPSTATTLADFQSNTTSAVSISYQGIITFGNAASALNFQGIAGQNLKITKDTLNWNNDVYVTRDAANTLALRNSTNAQVFNVYNTYTDASNYERGCIKWTTNVLEIGTEAAGTGTSRQLRLNAAATGIECRVGGTLIAEVRTTNLRPGLNSSYDLGSSGRSWRNVYLSPSSSITPASNGDLAIEATNNTTLTFKYKGSDGTVRSGTVALS